MILKIVCTFIIFKCLSLAGQMVNFDGTCLMTDCYHNHCNMLYVRLFRIQYTYIAHKNSLTHTQIARAYDNGQYKHLSGKIKFTVLINANFNELTDNESPDNFQSLL